jgi:hypothetical protein
MLKLTKTVPDAARQAEYDSLFSLSLPTDSTSRQTCTTLRQNRYATNSSARLCTVVNTRNPDIILQSYQLSNYESSADTIPRWYISDTVRLQRFRSNVHPCVTGHPVCRDAFLSGPSASCQRNRTKSSSTQLVLHMLFLRYVSLRLSEALC